MATSWSECATCMRSSVTIMQEQSRTWAGYRLTFVLHRLMSRCLWLTGRSSRLGQGSPIAYPEPSTAGSPVTTMHLLPRLFPLPRILGWALGVQWCHPYQYTLDEFIPILLNNINAWPVDRSFVKKLRNCLAKMISHSNISQCWFAD